MNQKHTRTLTVSGIADDSDYHKDISDTWTSANALALNGYPEQHVLYTQPVDGDGAQVDIDDSITFSYRLVLQWTQEGETVRQYGAKTTGCLIGVPYIDDLPPNVPRTAEVFVEFTTWSGEASGTTSIYVLQGAG